MGKKDKSKGVKSINKSSLIVAWLILIILILSIFGLTYIKFFGTDKEISDDQVVDTKVLQEIVNNFNNSQLLKQYKDNGVEMVAIFEDNHFSIEVTTGLNTNVYLFDFNSPYLSTVILPGSMEEFDLVFKTLIYASQERLKNVNDIDNHVDDIISNEIKIDGFYKVVADEIITYTMDISKVIDVDGEESTLTDENNNEVSDLENQSNNMEGVE